jgi:hypothetical protein
LQGGDAPDSSIERQENLFLMLWIYQRGGDVLRIETSFDNATNEYLLIIKRGQDDKRFERFKDAVSFQVRLESLENEIVQGYWKQVGDPIVLRDGWRIG